MYKEGFSNEKYTELQSKHIKERIDQFGGKLYLEFGGKLFDDFHASRVLPGFHPDSKIQMLKKLSDQAEIVIAIKAADIEKNKVRGDEQEVSAPDSSIPVWVVPTNEELVIARDTLRLVSEKNN